MANMVVIAFNAGVFGGRDLHSRGKRPRAVRVGSASEVERRLDARIDPDR
jgi:hypothetical protein